MFSAEGFDTPPRPSRPQTFSLPETFQNAAQKGSPSKFFGAARQKKSTKKRDIILLSINFFDTRNQWHSRGFPNEFFLGLWDKKFSAKNFDTPPLPVLLIHKLIRYRKLSETQHKTVSLQSFFKLRDKKFDENRDLFLLSINFYDTRNQWHTRGFLYDFFRHCETKCFQQKFLILPPPSISSTNFFATGNFPKHSTGRFPFKVFWHCETKKINKKSWHSPLKRKVFRYPKSVTL